jgi:hypothetical protein
MAKWITEAERMLIGGKLVESESRSWDESIIPRLKKSLAEPLQQTAVTWIRQLSPPKKLGGVGGKSPTRTC